MNKRALVYIWKFESFSCFFFTLKAEILVAEISKYIMCFVNRERLHAVLSNRQVELTSVSDGVLERERACLVQYLEECKKKKLVVEYGL